MKFLGGLVTYSAGVGGDIGRGIDKTLQASADVPKVQSPVQSLTTPGMCPIENEPFFCVLADSVLGTVVVLLIETLVDCLHAFTTRQFVECLRDVS